jgi:hypothetical protein
MLNRRFQVPPRESGSAIVPLGSVDLDNILCLQVERTVARDNCVSYLGMKLQIPANKHRLQYVNSRVRIHQYISGDLPVFHGPRRLADYDARGSLIENRRKAAA